MNKPRRAYDFLKDLPLTISHMKQAINTIQQGITELQANQQDLRNTTSDAIEEIRGSVRTVKQKQADLLHTAAPVAITVQATPVKSNDSRSLQADDHRLDGYYRAFEDAFRGSEEIISGRLEESYGAFLDSLPKEVKKAEVIDIGCGRGELLQIYDKHGMKPLGIDLNASMVERCVDLGLKAIQGDAIAYLKGLESSSIAGISGIHIVEHIPFEILYDLLNECYRVVKPGGFVLFETPNAENLSVGACTFWYDSSHLKPVPPDVLKFATEYVGFTPVKTLKFRPDVSEEDIPKSPNLARVYKQLFGPRDYAIIGRK